MTLRKKTFLIISITIIILIITLYYTTSIIMLDGFARIEKENFAKLEEENTIQNMIRAKDALSNDLSTLNSKTGDWANWDDTYTFVEDRNLKFIATNPTDTSFIQIGINVILIFNSSGVLIYSKAFDLDSNTEVQVPKSLKEIKPDDIIIKHNTISSSITGLILIPEGTMLIASRPILTSQGKGPSRGTLIFGRYFDNRKITKLSGITHFDLNAKRLDDKTLPPDFQEASLYLSDINPIYVKPLDKKTIASYTLIKDIYNISGIILKIEIPRIIYQQGQTAIRYFLILVVIVGITFGAITLLLLEKLVLSKVEHLSKDVSLISKSGDPSARVSLNGGDDELSCLSKEINKMLNALENSQNKLKVSERKNRALLDAIPDLMFQIKRDGTIFNYKATNDKELYLPSNEFLNKKLSDVLPSDISSKGMYYIEEAFKTHELQVYEYELNINGKIQNYESRVIVTDDDEVLAIICNITERKQIEEAKKKEILLKEIHHRVKNNLQVISSLLYLQSRSFDDKRIIEKFIESQNRIKLMALAHEKLYRSKDMENIDFLDYVYDLTDYLFRAYGRNNIKLNIDIVNIFMGIDTITPCGLIVNELVTNSLKYAFPNGEIGEININLKKNMGVYTLIICDNGVGFPKDLDFKTTNSLGLQLVNMLVEQIDGSIELDSSKGTKFTIVFKEIKYRKRG